MKVVDKFFKKLSEFDLANALVQENAPASSPTLKNVLDDFLLDKPDARAQFFKSMRRHLELTNKELSQFKTFIYNPSNADKLFKIKQKTLLHCIQFGIQQKHFSINKNFSPKVCGLEGIDNDLFDSIFAQCKADVLLTKPKIYQNKLFTISGQLPLFSAFQEEDQFSTPETERSSEDRPVISEIEPAPYQDESHKARHYEHILGSFNAIPAKDTLIKAKFGEHAFSLELNKQGDVIDKSPKTNLSTKEKEIIAFKQAELFLRNLVPGENTIFIKGNDPEQAARVHAALLYLISNNENLKNIRVMSVVPEQQIPEVSRFRSKANHKQMDTFINEKLTEISDEEKKAVSQSLNAVIAKKNSDESHFKNWKKDYNKMVNNDRLEELKLEDVNKVESYFTPSPRK